MKTTEKTANTGQFLWEGEMVNGYKAATSTNMPSGDLLFGDYSNLMFGMWGALDLVVDKSTKAKSGGTVLRIFQDADTAIRHEAAFSYGNGV